MVIERLTMSRALKISDRNASLSTINGCYPTTHIQLDVTSPDAPWILRTFNAKGLSKCIGGDEFYVTYTAKGAADEHPSAVALIDDRGNGIYELNFIASPINAPNITSFASAGGSITIYHEYTCGIGTLPPPAKSEWASGGAINFDYKIADLPSAPPIREFVMPKPVDLGQYQAVAVVGDSLAQQFVLEGGREHDNLELTHCGGVMTQKTVKNFIKCAQKATTAMQKNADNDGLTIRRGWLWWWDISSGIFSRMRTVRTEKTLKSI